jgi:hypothetical protein
VRRSASSTCRSVDYPTASSAKDFWLLDDSHVVLMRYDGHGRFLGAEVADSAVLPIYLAARDSVWDAAEPFESWWARHRE